MLKRNFSPVLSVALLDAVLKLFRPPNDNAWTQADRRARLQTILTTLVAVTLFLGSGGVVIWSLFRS